MASCCIPQFLNPRLSHWLLALVLTMTSHFSVIESAQIQLRGEIGGNVAFRCPVVKHKTITFLYLQKVPSLFVNGYYATKDMDNIHTWENTRLDGDKTTVHMDSLNISHSGDYQCLIKYNDSELTLETVIHLSLTANYSKPEATVFCGDEFSCLVTCASHGGYPGTKMMWNVTDSQMWKVVNDSTMSDPDTSMVNSSSTAHFNCSNGERNFSCSVGNITSNMFSVCTPKDPPNSTFNPYVIVAICALVIFCIIIVALWRKYKKGHEGREATDVERECGVAVFKEELISLNENKQGEEAS